MTTLLKKLPMREGWTWGREDRSLVGRRERVDDAGAQE
jgi:hypothetical protein